MTKPPEGEFSRGWQARLLSMPFEQGAAKANGKLNDPDSPKQGHDVMTAFMNRNHHQQGYDECSQGKTRVAVLQTRGGEIATRQEEENPEEVHCSHPPYE